jgi:hypothetical protein
LALGALSALPLVTLKSTMFMAMPVSVLQMALAAGCGISAMLFRSSSKVDRPNFAFFVNHATQEEALKMLKIVPKQPRNRVQVGSSISPMADFILSVICIALCIWPLVLVFLLDSLFPLFMVIAFVTFYAVVVA